MNHYLFIVNKTDFDLEKRRLFCHYTATEDNLTLLTNLNSTEVLVTDGEYSAKDFEKFLDENNINFEEAII